METEKCAMCKGSGKIMVIRQDGAIVFSLWTYLVRWTGPTDALFVEGNCPACKGTGIVEVSNER